MKNEIGNISTEFVVVLRQIERFLDPPVKAILKNEVFNKEWVDSEKWE